MIFVGQFEAYSQCPWPHSRNSSSALCTFGIQVSQCTIIRGTGRGDVKSGFPFSYARFSVPQFHEMFVLPLLCSQDHLSSVREGVYCSFRVFKNRPQVIQPL